MIGTLIQPPKWYITLQILFMRLKKSKPQNHYLELAVLWSFEAVFMKSNFHSCNCMHCCALILESLWFLHSLACVLVWKWNFNLDYPDFLGSYSNYTDTAVVKQANDTSGEMELEGGVGICQIFTWYLSAVVMEVGNFSSLFSLLAMVGSRWPYLFVCYAEVSVFNKQICSF